MGIDPDHAEALFGECGADALDGRGGSAMRAGYDDGEFFLVLDDTADFGDNAVEDLHEAFDALCPLMLDRLAECLIGIRELDVIVSVKQITSLVECCHIHGVRPQARAPRPS